MKRIALAALLVGLLSTSSSYGQDKNPVVVVDTSLGTIKIELYEKKAPITVKNFLDYVDAKHYDGTIFHRVIKDFMIQGGGMEPGLKEKPTKAPIKNESTNGLSNERGTIAMARTPVADSATSQFFINVVDNTFLDKAKAGDKRRLLRSSARSLRAWMWWTKSGRVDPGGKGAVPVPGRSHLAQCGGPSNVLVAFTAGGVALCATTRWTLRRQRPDRRIGTESAILCVL